MATDMKTATLPSLRVDPSLRLAAEEVLQEGESLSSFVEHSVRAQIDLRKSQEAFVARGLAARDAAEAAGTFIAAGTVLKKLESRLARAKKKSP